MQNTIQNATPDRSRPGLSTTTIGTVAQQGAGGNYATEEQRKRGRGGRRVREGREIEGYDGRSGSRNSECGDSDWQRKRVS